MNEAILAMVLELDVLRHKREIADSFRTAREKLTPPPKSALQLLREAMTNVLVEGAYNNAIANMQHSSLLQQSALVANPYNSCGCRGIQTLWPWSWPQYPYPF